MIGGLFSGTGDPDADARNQALTLFGASMLSGAGSGRNFSAIFGNSVAQAQAGYGQALDARSKRDYVQSLMADQQAQADQRRASVAELQRKTAAAAELERAQKAFWQKAGGMGAQQPTGFRDANIAMTGNAPPGYTPPAQQAPAGRMGIPPAMFAEAQMLGIDPATLKQMAEAQDWGRATVARLAQTRDAQGRPVQMQLDQFGQPVGAPLAPEYKPQMVNQGDRQTLVDLNSARDGQSFAMNMSPGERDASARGWAGVRQAADRFAFDKDQSRNPAAEKPPSGYRWTPDGGLAFVPGGPADPAVARPAAPTEDERKAAGWLMQADKAYADMLKATAANPAAAKPGWIESAPLLPEGLKNASRSPERQLFNQAASALSEAVLRAATGAGQNEAEARQKVAELTPQWGDKPEVIQQKNDSAQMYLAALAARAGRAAPGGVAAGVGAQPAQQGPAAPAPKAPAADAPKPKSRVVKLDDGTSVGADLGPDGNYYVTRGGKRYRVEE
jgi:hypothetical protein